MNEQNNSTISRQEYLVTIIGSFLLLFIVYRHTYAQFGTDTWGDFPAHLYRLLPSFRSAQWWKGWMLAPHCLWHLTVLLFYYILKMPLEISASYATCLYSVLYYWVLVWCIKKISIYSGSVLNAGFRNIIALGFCFAQSIYLSWLDCGDGYLGSFSMNPMHNPTQMSVRVFSLLCICLVYEILALAEKKDTYRPIFFDIRGKQLKYNILLAVFLFLSAVMKPTFAQMFIPGVAFYMLGILLTKLVRKTGDALPYFKRCLAMLSCAAPALIYMLLQYVAFFFLEGSFESDGGLVITKWLEVWKLFTDNVYLSVLLGMAFPIYMIITDARFFLKSIPGRISLICYGFSFLEAALLGEAGVRMNHANFIWPMMSAMLLLWFVALMRLIMLEKETENNARGRRFVIAGWALFCVHILCGVLYLIK